MALFPCRDHSLLYYNASTSVPKKFNTPTQGIILYYWVNRMWCHEMAEALVKIMLLLQGYSYMHKNFVIIYLIMPREDI